MSMEILEAVQSFLQSNAVSPQWQSILSARFKKTEAMIREGYWIPCLELPGLMLSGLNKDRSDSLLLSMISTFIYLGADLLDDLHDGDLKTDEISPAETTLLSATLLTVFPILAIARLKTTAETKNAMQTSIARSLLKMSEGQCLDLRLAYKGGASLKDVKESIRAKSGEEAALSCLLAAQFADLPSSQKKLCEDFGCLLGTVLQISSDFYDLMWSPTTGKPGHSLPTAFCMEKLEGEAKEEFVTLFKAAAKNHDRLRSLRDILAGSGAVDYTAIVIEDICQQLIRTLDMLKLREEAETYLKKRIGSISLLQKQPERRQYEGVITAC